MDMNIVCLDLEGVLVPEIWIAFAEASGIPELKRTTRDEPDYDKLMKWRIGILKEHGLTPMKNCFKSVYGSPIFTYMRNYRMNYAASLLRSDKTLKVAEIAGLVGYDSPSKFASAFHQTMGKTPLEYRKSII